MAEFIKRFYEKKIRHIMGGPSLSRFFLGADRGERPWYCIREKNVWKSDKSWEPEKIWKFENLKIWKFENLKIWKFENLNSKIKMA